MTDTPHLGLPLIEAAQAQKHVSHNEALTLLDILVQLTAESRALTAPPPTPAENSRYIVKATGTGAFAGKDNQIAQYSVGGWLFYPPSTGWLAFVADESALLAWDGGAWVAAVGAPGGISELQNLALLGVGTTADSTNPFTAKLNNSLWVSRTVGEGGDGNLRYKMSKESAAKTLSVLFQDNFSGRAEIGLTGDDDFHFKVSPDGSTWIDALIIDKSTGSAKINAGFFLTGDIAPSQITSDQNDYNPTGLSASSVLRLSTDAARNITGISGGGDGRIISIVNIGSNNIVLKDASTSSSAANRFAFGADITLLAKQSAILWYDATDSRWKLLAASQSGGGSPPDFSVITGTAAISQGGTGATTASAARANLGLGSAATLDVGTSANKIVQLDGSARLPAVDGSQLTNLSGGGGGGSVPADLDLLLAELSLGVADALNVAQFLGASGNRLADSFDALTYVDTGGATNLDTGTAGLLKPTVPTQASAASAGTTLVSSGYTVFSREFALTNGSTVTAVGIYSTNAYTYTLKILKRNSAGNYDVVVSQAAAVHAGGGNQIFSLSSPYAVPNDGALYYVGFYVASGTPNNTATGNARGYKIGDITGSGQSGFTEDTGGGPVVSVVYHPNNMTAKSTALTAAAVPTTAKLVARTKHIDTITLGTDLIFAVSRDGGTTFSNASMNDRFTANAIHVLESDAIDVSGQPSGSSIKWKITTANNKMVEIRDIYVYWT